MNNEGFSKQYRLRKRSEYLFIQKSASRIHTDSFIILYKPTTNNYPRLGITVTKKVGTAVVRNRIKRLIKEYFRKNKDRFGSNDVVIISKRGCIPKSINEVNSELSTCNFT